MNATGVSEKRIRALQLIGAVDPDLLNFNAERKPEPVAGRTAIVQMIVNHCERYCSNSSIHGMKYLVDSRLSWLER